MATNDWLVNGTAGWTTGADWSTGSVPATGDDVLIGLNSHAATVKSSSDVTIHTLEITSGDTLDLTGGNFNVTNGLPFGMFGFIDVDSANFQIDGGTINNSATIDLSPSGNITTDLTIYNSVQLNGGGSIVFAGNGNDGILGGISTAALTDFDNNISGSGFIEGLVFTNYATIETNNVLGAGTLRIVGSAYGGSFDDRNSLFADNGGTVELGDWAGTASSTILVDDGAISLLSTGAVTTLEIANSVTITTAGSGHVGLIGLDGTHPEDDRIVSNGNTASLTLGQQMEVLNTGTIGDAHLTLTNDGDIRATGDTLVINTGANTIINAGSMEADSRSTAPSYLDIQSAVQNTGGSISAGGNGLVTFDQAVTISNTSFSTGTIGAYGGSVIFFKSVTNNGGVIADDGTITVHSSILCLNGGKIEIGTGGSLGLAAGGTVSQGVEFTGTNALLVLEQDAGQIGTSISGINSGDSINLDFLTYAAGDHTVWTQTSGGEGTISVEAANNSLLATLVIEGTWNSQDFEVTADTRNGVEVALPIKAATIEAANLGVLRVADTSADASTVAANINARDLTFAAYENQLISQAQSTTVPALVTYDFFFGTTPTSNGVDFLTNFATQIQTPAGGGFSVVNSYVNMAATNAINASSSFAATYGSAAVPSEQTFFTNVYTQLFGHAPSAGATNNYFQTQTFNLPNGTHITGTTFDFYKEYVRESLPAAQQTAANLENGARGAVVGTLLYLAEQDPTTQYAQATTHFLQDAAVETPAYQVPLIGTYLASSIPHIA